jgi:hypothetical protein
MSDSDQPTRHEYSPADIISHIQRLADGDDPPTRREFDTDDDAPSATTVRDRFGTWTTAVEAAGLTPRTPKGHPQYSEDELITHIQRLADGDGPPTQREFDTADDTPSVTAVTTQFDSWSTALTAAGFQPPNRRSGGSSQQWSEDDIISHIQRLADGDDPPTTREFNADDDAPSVATVRRYFDTWANAIKAAGLQPYSVSSQYDRDELLNWLIAHRAEFGEWPTHGTLADWPGPSVSPYQREFGTLKQALTTAQQTIDNE